MRGSRGRTDHLLYILAPLAPPGLRTPHLKHHPGVQTTPPHFQMQSENKYFFLHSSLNERGERNG